MALKIFSFFSGAGFLDLGFEASDFDVVFINESHKPFLDAYLYARDKMGLKELKFGYHDKSVEELVKEKSTYLKSLVEDTRRSGNMVGFIAGPPCPDFSVGGKNRGRKGDKGALTEVYFELITQQKPDFFLFENVKGLWRTTKHRDFYEEMKAKVQESEKGYALTEQLINSIEFGVPQDRDRIILLGFRKELLKAMGHKFTEENMLPDDVFPWTQHAKYSKERIFKRNWPETDPFDEDSSLPKPKSIVKELTVEHWFEKNDVLNHPNALHHFQPRAALPKFLSIEEGDVSKKSFKRLHRWRFSPTAAYGNNEVHIHPYKPRRISAAEALAVQSLPASYELPENMTLTNMFKAIGNGVPYLASKGLAISIHDFLCE